MALRSPKDLQDKPAPGADLTAHDVHIFWDSASNFGAYLKAVRERRQWTTRQAAAKFGVSQAYISKLENQERKQAPGEALVRRVADVYGLDFREVMHEAGYRFDIPPSLELKITVDQAFRKLVEDPRFRPSGYHPDEERFLAPIVRQQMVDLALNVARVVREQDFDLDAWLREGGGE